MYLALLSIFLLEATLTDSFDMEEHWEDMSEIMELETEPIKQEDRVKSSESNYAVFQKLISSRNVTSGSRMEQTGCSTPNAQSTSTPTSSSQGVSPCMPMATPASTTPQLYEPSKKRLYSQDESFLQNDVPAAGTPSSSLFNENQSTCELKGTLATNKRIKTFNTAQDQEYLHTMSAIYSNDVVSEFKKLLPILTNMKKIFCLNENFSELISPDKFTSLDSIDNFFPEMSLYLKGFSFREDPKAFAYQKIVLNIPTCLSSEFPEKLNLVWLNLTRSAHTASKEFDLDLLIRIMIRKITSGDHAVSETKSCILLVLYTYGVLGDEKLKTFVYSIIILLDNVKKENQEIVNHYLRRLIYIIFNCVDFKESLLNPKGSETGKGGESPVIFSEVMFLYYLYRKDPKRLEKFVQRFPANKTLDQVDAHFFIHYDHIIVRNIYRTVNAILEGIRFVE